MLIVYGKILFWEVVVGWKTYPVLKIQILDFMQRGIPPSLLSCCLKTLRMSLIAENSLSRTNNIWEQWNPSMPLNCSCHHDNKQLITTIWHGQIKGITSENKKQFVFALAKRRSIRWTTAKPLRVKYLHR